MGMGVMGQAMGTALGMVTDPMKQAQENDGERRHQLALMKKTWGQRQKEAEWNQKLALQGMEKSGLPILTKQLEAGGFNKGLALSGGASNPGGVTASAAPQTASAGGRPSTTMDISGAMLQSEQMEQVKAQTENIRANTNKTNIEASNIEEPIRAGLNKTQAETNKIQTDNEIANILKNVQNLTQEEQIQQIKALANKTTGEARSAMVQGDVSTQTREAVISEAKARSVGEALENVLKASQAELQGYQKIEIKEKIRKMQAEIAQGWEGLTQNEKRLKIEQFGKELQSEYPNLMNVGGKLINEIVNGLQKIGEKATGRKPAENYRKM